MTEEELEELAWNNIPYGYNDVQERCFGTGDYEPSEDHSVERECYVEGFEKGFRKGETSPDDETIEKIIKLVGKWNHYMSQTFGDIDNKEDCLSYIKNNWNEQ